MKRFAAWLAAFACLVMTAAPAYAAGPYTTNTSGTTQNGILEALTDIANSVAGSGSAVAQGSTTSGQTGPLVQCAVTTAAPTYVSGKTDPCSLTLSGAMRVDGSAVTQPVSAASLPLPSGAATSALQDETYAPLTPAAATAIKSNLAGCTYTAAKFTATDGQQMGLQCGTRGSLIVQLSGGDSNSIVPTTAWSVDDQGFGGQSGIVTSSMMYLADVAGTNGDRARSVTNGTDSTGTGIQAVGLVAQCDDSSPTATSENQFGNIRMACGTRALLMRPFESRANSWVYAAASGGISNTTTAVTILAADATRRICITSLDLSWSTLGAGTEVVIRDGAGGSVLWRGYLDTVAGRFAPPPFETPVCGTANTLMEVATISAVTGAVYFNARGFYAAN